MKKKGIALSIIGIILVSSVLIVLVSKNIKKTFMQDGIMFAVNVDGVSQKTFPTGTNYYVDVDCENGKGSYVYDTTTSTWKVAVGEITGNATCNVSYTSSPSTLKSIVESQDNRVAFGSEGVVDETQSEIPDWDNATAVTNLSPSYFRNTFNTSTTQTAIGSYWTYDTSTGVFTSVPSTMTTSGSSAYYHVYAQIKEDGYYQICYTISNGLINNALSIGVGTSNKANISASNQIKEGCYSLGALTASQYINISENAYSGTSSPVMTFTLEKAGAKIANAGYRYEGQNPNNYVWFNNEMWRIIGSIPTCLNSDCSTSENLVKMIRKNSIGSIVYDANGIGEWGANTLYALLNTYYYGNTENAKTDATGTSYCYGYQNSSITKCDYSVIGMKNTDYYGSMIKNVYWNTGAAERTAESATIAYSRELARKKEGYIGLMSASDYGYASSATTRRALIDYNNATISSNNWLYTSNHEWMNIQGSGRTDIALSVDNCSMNIVYVNGSLGVRPVVYLDSSVKVVSGDGTEANPYQLMKAN